MTKHVRALRSKRRFYTMHLWGLRKHDRINISPENKHFCGENEFFAEYKYKSPYFC